MEHQDWLCNIINHHIKFHPSDDLWTFLTPFILIQHMTHYDSHSLEAVSYSSLSQVNRSSHLSIYILFFHDKSLCFILLLYFLSDLSSDSSCCLSRMGFPTRLKSKKVEISKEKMSWMIIKEKLSEGCHEREWARTSVSSREKNIKKNLVIVTTKSKSRMQTVSNGCVGRGEGNRGVWRVSQCWRPHQVS